MSSWKHLFHTQSYSCLSYLKELICKSTMSWNIHIVLIWQGSYTSIQSCDRCVNISVTWGEHISWPQELHNSACMGKKGSLQQFPESQFCRLLLAWGNLSSSVHTISFNRTLQLVRQKSSSFDITMENWRCFLKRLPMWKRTAINISDFEAECVINLLTKLCILPSLSAVFYQYDLHSERSRLPDYKNPLFI